MAWLPFYASESDLSTLLSHLNASEEIAFVVSNGPGKWVAVQSIELLKDGRYCLWHVPSGPLPLFRGAKEAPDEITNPFAGWSDARAGFEIIEPFFGAGHPGVFWLNVRCKAKHRVSGEPLVGLSSFEWIGNYFKAVGIAAKPETAKFWKALGRWFKKVTVKVPRGGPQEPTPPEIWAFAGAQAMFEAGVRGGNV
jgi:hypothetical protein